MIRVVAILAHPDDAEILAGGTLCKHRQRGDSVEICCLTYTVDSLRGQEGAEGARRLGVDFTCFGLPDMGVSRYTPADVERLAAFLLARPPTIVLTHWQDDAHPDHAASVRLVVEVLLRYAVTHGLEDVDASRRIFPQVWSCDTYGALGSHGGFEAQWYIDVSAVWEQKIHALAAHQSQNPAHWTDLVQRHDAFYGSRCNRPYAEGFRRLSLAFVNNLPAYEYLP
jgi:LmbE family N-acetylglucosaminyl deacetylase